MIIGRGIVTLNHYGESISLENFKTIMGNIISHTSLKTVLALLCLSFQWVFGLQYEGLMVVGSLILIDTMSGFMKSYKNHEVCSRDFFRVLIKCFVYFILMATSHLVDKALPLEFAAKTTEAFLAITEAISIMENFGALGFLVPSHLIKRLKYFQSSGDDEEDTTKK